MRSYIGWGGDRNILYKNLEEKWERKSPKRTASIRNGLEPSQITWKPFGNQFFFSLVISLTKREGTLGQRLNVT